MLKELSEPLQKFFGFLGASLTGITAVFTAAGFLAERARLTMLGLPSTTFDLQLYVETGARFLSYLPLYLGYALFYTLLSWITGALRWIDRAAGLAVAGIVFLVVVGALIVGIFRFVRARWRGFGNEVAKPPSAIERLVGGRTGRFLAANISWVLFPFLFIQFIGAYQLTVALEINNLLFDPTPAEVETPRLQTSPVTAQQLTNWIVTNDAISAMQYMGWLFLITLATVWGLHRVRDLHARGGGQKLKFWQVTWFAASMMLLITQLTLLPVNYGALLSGNRFVEVSVEHAGEVESVLPADDRLYLLHETGSGFYFYSVSKRKLWYVLRGDIRSIEYRQMANVLGDHP